MDRRNFAHAGQVKRSAARQYCEDNAMYRFTVDQLRASGHAARDAIQKYHPIKATTALECWGHTLGRPWSSLMAEASQKGYVRVAPSLSRLIEAMAHRRKPVSDFVAVEIMTHAVAETGLKDRREKPVTGARKEAMRKLAALAIDTMERERVFAWDYATQPTVNEGSLVFDVQAHRAQVHWRDVGFGELSVEIGIASVGLTDIDLKRDQLARNAWIARCRFWIERQDGPFVQGLMPTGSLMLTQAGKSLMASLQLPPPEVRRYRFVDKIWM
jgi:hypothetical protein